MHVIADTEALVADGTLTPDQAAILERRSREVMVTLAVNAILCFGILAATVGFIFWLADPFLVAIVGGLMLAGGLAVLARAGANYAMFGNSAVLIGVGMLLGGATVELVDRYEQLAGWGAGRADLSLAMAHQRMVRAVRPRHSPADGAEHASWRYRNSDAAA